MMYIQGKLHRCGTQAGTQGPRLQRALGWIEVSAINILKFSITLSLSLCFVNQVGGCGRQPCTHVSRGDRQKLAVGCPRHPIERQHVRPVSRDSQRSHGAQEFRETQSQYPSTCCSFDK